MFLKLIIFALLQQNEPHRVIIAHNSRVDIDLVLKLEHGLLSNLAVLLQIIDLHLVVLLHMVLVFLLAAGRGLNQQTNLSLVDLDDALDLLWREVVNSAFFGFLPAQDVVGLCADRVGLAALVEIQLLELVLL